MNLVADFVLVFGFAITTVMLFILANSKKRRLPQKILMVFLTFVLLTIACFYANLHDLRFLYLVTVFFENGERLLFGPIIYIYVKSLFLKERHLIRNHFGHFIPFLLYTIVVTIPLVISIFFGKPIFDYLVPLHDRPYLSFSKDLYLIVYILFSIRHFFRFKSIMKFNYSSFIAANIEWLKKFLFSFLGLLLIDLLITTYEVVFGHFTDWDTGYVTVTILIFLVAYLGYKGAKQSAIVVPDFLINEGVGKANTANRSIELSEEELSDLKRKLEEVISNEKPYLDQEITLSSLAKLVGTSEKKLSTLLNQSLEISFYDFINGHRVAAVKEKLKEEENNKYSIIGLAYAAGFNSKSSFYRAFKKETGVSPVAYKKKQYN